MPLFLTIRRFVIEQTEKLQTTFAVRKNGRAILGTAKIPYGIFGTVPLHQKGRTAKSSRRRFRGKDSANGIFVKRISAFWPEYRINDVHYSDNKKSNLKRLDFFALDC